MQDWHVEDILRLAPHSTIALEAQRNAQPAFWTMLGHDGVHIWGEHQEKTRTAVDISLLHHESAGYFCICNSVRPCAHNLALLLMYREQNTAFKQTQPPPFVREKFLRESVLTRPDDVRPDIERGLLGLKRWLTDLIRHGLAEPHVREFVFWDAMADRMRAAWMPGISQWLRDIASIPVRRGGWTEPLLDELGRLYLLARSFERYDALSYEAQADMREAIGWRLKPEEFQAEPVTDAWLVLGRRQRALHNRIAEQHLWLYGKRTGQVAELHDIGGEDVLKTRTAGLQVGHVRELTLAYLPSRAPLKAISLERGGWPDKNGITGQTIDAAIAWAGRNLAANPWLRHVPMLLENVHVDRFNKGWVVRHENGVCLPVASYFRHQWALHALGGGQALRFAGLWNGTGLYPLSAFVDGRVIDFDQLPIYRDR